MYNIYMSVKKFLFLTKCLKILLNLPFPPLSSVPAVWYKGGKIVVCIHPWLEGFVHLPDFIYRCRLILSLDGHRD